MASSTAINVTEQLTIQSSPLTSSDNGNSEIVFNPQREVDFDEKKADATVEVLERSETQPTPRMQGYVQSVHGLFTKKTALRWGAVLWKFAKFTGPGTIISVAYVDPDNYQTAVSAGAEFKYKLLFMILISNLIAIYLQVSVFLKRGSRQDLYPRDQMLIRQ